LYNDVVSLWSKTKTHYTPTLIVAYGAMNGENYWYQHTNVWEEKRLLNFTPRSVIDPRSRHRTMIPEEEYENGHIAIAKHCKKLSDAGVKVNLGAHGQIQGIGAHWEMWMLAQGGMSSLEALRCATQNGADYLGMGDQIGSIEAGKLADLVVIDGDVLKDIRSSKNITHTMINGVLYDANSMDQMNGSGKKRTPFYWELPGCQDSGTLHHGSQSKCSCRH
jgi:imidazolonepropionase-like amidohydrolase